MSKGKKFIFLGAPGAGKGTQALLLAQHCQIPHISTGDILRAEVAASSDLGKQARDYMDRGELVPDSLLLDMIRARLAQPDAAGGWILDGFPRNVSQAEFLDRLLAELDMGFDLAVNLEVPDEVLVSRMLERGRADDNEETIRNRLIVYREKTAPLIDYYQNTDKLKTIDGNRSPAEVTASMNALVDG
jgi:adenylate kinase